MSEAAHLSRYDRERVCVPQACDCQRENCRYRSFLEDCDTGQYLFQICNHNLLLADVIHRMLYLEFFKLLEEGTQFQKCGRCGRYFLSKGDYHGQYCDRVAPGESRTCQQLAAQESYQNKLKENDGQNALNIYQKYYKRYFARVTSGRLKKEKFKQWQYEAVQLRDSCLNGELSLK